VSGAGSGQSFSAGPGPAQGGPSRLSPSEQNQLRKENGPPRIGLLNKAKPGQRFSDDRFVTTQLSFSDAEKNRHRGRAGRGGGGRGADAELAARLRSRAEEGRPPPVSGRASAEAGLGPQSIDVQQSTVTGVDSPSGSRW